MYLNFSTQPYSFTLLGLSLALSLLLIMVHLSSSLGSISIETHTFDSVHNKKKLSGIKQKIHKCKNQKDIYSTKNTWTREHLLVFKHSTLAWVLAASVYHDLNNNKNNVLFHWGINNTGRNKRYHNYRIIWNIIFHTSTTKCYSITFLYQMRTISICTKKKSTNNDIICR